MKKTISVLLAALMLLSVVPFAVSAEDGTDNQVKFIAEFDELRGIDFSGMIRDKTTINKGRIVLDNKGDTDTDRESIWDEVEIDENGVAHFFWVDYDGEKYDDYIPLSVYDWEVEVRAVNGNLFDDVASFSFTITDVYENIGRKSFWLDTRPLVEVTKCDGDLVKEMTLCFIPGEGPLLPLTVDTDKTIEMTASLKGTELRTYTLVPLKYDGKGTLTVSVRNTDGSEGAALHDAKIYAEGDSLSLYNFGFAVPQGLFRYNGMESEGFFASDYTEDEIWNIPVRTILNIRIPKTLEKIMNKIVKCVPSSLQPLFVLSIIPMVCPFPITRIYRALKGSLAAYGYDINALIKDAVRSGNFKDALGFLCGNLF